MQLNAGGILYGICHKKKNLKKEKEKFPQAASDIWKYISKQKKPKRYWGKSEFVYANILYLYVLIIYKIWNTVCLKIKVSQASWKAAEKKIWQILFYWICLL